MRRLPNLARLVVASLVLAFSMTTPALAATATTPSASSTANNGQALEIAPPVIYLTANPGQTVSTQLYIRDISGGNLVVTNQVNDFVASGEDGTPKVLLNENTPDPYSLKGWITPIPQLLLIPHEIKALTVNVNVPSNASPGGHYGVIRFTGTAPSLQNSGVSLSASLGALLLLTVNGNIVQKLSIQQFSAEKDGKASSIFQSGPLDFVEVFKNTGNVHVQPLGNVVIKDMFGKKLATLPVNQPPGNVLPGSSRKFTQTLDKSVIGTKRLFGHYSANLTVTYGTNKQVLTQTIGFWVIPYKQVAAVIFGLIALFFILRFGLRRYNRYIRNQANKQK